MEIRMRPALVLAFALLGAAVTAGAAPSAAPEPYVAHEWGTFTSVQGADGEQLWWQPLVDTDLPAFVYNESRDNGG